MYCPEDYATRGQMAAFFHRFSNSGVVNAGTLDGKDSAEFLGVNGKAADSDLLDGKDSTEFVQVGDTASDSDTLDGKDSTEFLSSTINVRTNTQSYLLGTAIDQAVSCQAGEVLIGGGFQAEGSASVNITDSYPNGSDWVVGGTATVSADVTTYAICASVG
ncbi:MAG: hypothetical protein Q8Q52_04695 [Acidimicrobiia bacterium]|nr:hypothetical protein [Acidimicrobiia bacterium]